MSDNPVTLEFAKRLEREMPGQPEAILASAYLAERARAEEAEDERDAAKGRVVERDERIAALEGERKRMRSFVAYIARCPECAGETECVTSCTRHSGMREEARALLSPTSEEAADA